MICLIVLAYCTKSLNTIKVDNDRILKKQGHQEMALLFVVFRMEKSIEYWGCMRISHDFDYLLALFRR